MANTNLKEDDTLVAITLDPIDDFDAALIIMKGLHDKKKADYSSSHNRFSNFEFAAKSSGMTTAQTFEVLIGVKQARLIELLAGKVPKNESIEDTLLDRAIYCILAYVYHRKIRDKS